MFCIVKRLHFHGCQEKTLDGEHTLFKKEFHRLLYNVYIDLGFVTASTKKVALKLNF